MEHEEGGGPEAVELTSEQPGWTAAHAGLRVVYAALAMRLVLFVLTILMSVAMMGARSRGFAELTVIVTTVFALAISITAEVGLVRYVSVPSRSGGQGLAIAALVLASIALLIGLVDSVTVLADVRRAIRHGAGGLGNGVTLIAGLASVAMLFTFLGSVSKVSDHLGRPEIAAKARKGAALLIAVLVTALLTGALVVATRARSAGLTLLLLFVVAGLAVWMLITCIGATGDLASAIRDDRGIEHAFD